jgi:acyl-CoA reductase-like NAD-dependent aldehyde dehydrogenase
MVDQYKMYINGKWVDAESGKTYSVVNPATEEEIARIPLGDRADVNKAVEAARNAFPIWSKKPQEERSAILHAIADSIEKRLPELIEIDIVDHGSTQMIAGAFASGIPHKFRFAADNSMNLLGVGEVRPTAPGTIPYIKREPIGVCAGIEPWNVPLMVCEKMSAAMATGNTSVMKPASVNSLAAIKIVEIMEEHDVPPGVMNIVTGPGGTVGEALASHPDVNMVGFTGSCETGKAIMAAASGTVKRLFLELGGKNPFIVLEDADLDAALGTGVMMLYFNTGMICGSPGRFYVHEKVYDEFVDRFVAESKKVIVGNPKDEKTQMGPVVSAEHRDRVESYIKIGIEEGAKLLLGGKRPTEPPLDKGYYIMPTVFAGVTQNMRIAREEIFGPVACIMKYTDKDDIIELANDTKFGLSASVWTKDPAKGVRYANEIRAGTVWINNHMALEGSLPLPWGGYKESGFGKASGLMGLMEYTQAKVISLDVHG